MIRLDEHAAMTFWITEHIALHLYDPIFYGAKTLHGLLYDVLNYFVQLIRCLISRWSPALVGQSIAFDGSCRFFVPCLDPRITSWYSRRRHCLRLSRRLTSPLSENACYCCWSCRWSCAWLRLVDRSCGRLQNHWPVVVLYKLIRSRRAQIYRQWTRNVVNKHRSVGAVSVSSKLLDHLKVTTISKYHHFLEANERSKNIHRKTKCA